MKKSISVQRPNGKDTFPLLLQGGKWNGMFINLVNGDIDIIVSPMTRTIERNNASSFLPKITSAVANLALYIKTIDSELVSWTSFTQEFSITLWIVIIIGSIAIGLVITIFKNGVKNIFHFQIIPNVWEIFTITFGNGKISSLGTSNYDQISKTSILISGLILWISYRSFLTATLSVPVEKNLPFDSLEGILESDYM